MSNEDLFIALNPVDYRKDRSELLKSQEKMLFAQKRLYKIHILNERKKELRLKLSQLFSELLNEVENFRLKIPYIGIPESEIIEQPIRKPRTVKQKKKTKSKQKKKAKAKKSKSKKEKTPEKSIDDELEEIRRKLRKLNG